VLAEQRNCSQGAKRRKSGRLVTGSTMTDAHQMKLGTLGGAATFAGEATEAIRARMTLFGEPLYFKSMDDCWNELANGTVDAVVLGAERTGQPHHGSAVVTRGFYVMNMLALPLLCNLYGKPGTHLTTLRRVTGHGSLQQCTRWLDAHLPGVPREMHGLNSVEAAKAVLAGDGSAAVVGSRSLPRAVPGLQRMAERIDDGQISNWWVVSAAPHFADRPDTVIVVGEFGPDGGLGAMIASLGDEGYRLATVAGFPADHDISTYRYLARFDGNGTRDGVERALRPFDARLAGAFDRL
jgi:prephenate dehydratase